MTDAPCGRREGELHRCSPRPLGREDGRARRTATAPPWRGHGRGAGLRGHGLERGSALSWLEDERVTSERRCSKN
jgi:hypothetical protein